MFVTFIIIMWLTPFCKIIEILLNSHLYRDTHVYILDPCIREFCFLKMVANCACANSSNSLIFYMIFYSWVNTKVFLFIKMFKCDISSANNIQPSNDWFIIMSWTKNKKMLKQWTVANIFLIQEEVCVQIFSFWSKKCVRFAMNWQSTLLCLSWNVNETMKIVWYQNKDVWFNSYFLHFII